jgi:hypothetical protein
MLFEMSSGNYYAVESSANLRSCKMLEQFTLTNSRELVLFHRGWMAGLIDKNEFKHDGEGKKRCPKKRTQKKAN